MDNTTTTTNDISQQLNDIADQFQAVAPAPQPVAKKKARIVSIEAAYEDTEVLVPLDCEEYVKQFKKREQTTATAILDMCRVVYEADKALDEEDFAEFCTQVGYTSSSSTIRKFIAIGKVQPRMKDYADQLPTGWTSIYQLTQIPAKTFENMLAAGKSLTLLTGKDVRELVQMTRPIDSYTSHLPTEKVTQSPIFAKVCFTRHDIDRTDWLLAKNAFAAIEARLPIKVILDAETENVYQQAKLASYDVQKSKFDVKQGDLSKWGEGLLPPTDPKVASTATK